MGEYSKNMNNPITYIRHKKKFLHVTKLKYSSGLGDVVASILHSKFVGPITYMFTGNLEPCATCNSRRVILNKLFPMAIWSYFFKTVEDMHDDIKKEYRKIGKDYVYIAANRTEPISIRLPDNHPMAKILENHPAHQKVGYYVSEKRSSFNSDKSVLTETTIYKKL
jgi:hypothetical protein